MSVEPIPGERAAVAETGDERLLVIADYHAGIESVLQAEGVEIEQQADRRRERLLGLLAETDADRLIVLGDLVHSIGDPWDAERDELRALFDALAVPVTLAKGNHDGEIEPLLAEIDHPVSVTPAGGSRLGSVGVVHGHTWPEPAVLAAETVCMGHEHPVVRLEDRVGGSRIERVWLRGGLDPAGFEPSDTPDSGGELVVFPAFNDRSGGTWVNVEGQEFLSPFLPDGLDGGEAYLLDGTRLGAFRNV
jgi:putative SbcD/Mre11-related phosphoesterase